MKKLSKTAVILSTALIIFVLTSSKALAGGGILAIGNHNDSRSEFKNSGWGDRSTYTCTIPCYKDDFPGVIYAKDHDEDDESKGVQVVKVKFETDDSHSKVFLDLYGKGSETLRVRLDGGRVYNITSKMMDSDENDWGHYKLQLGYLRKGDHTLVFSVRNDHRGDGAFVWDYISMGYDTDADEDLVTKADILIDRGVPGKGILHAPGLQKPFNPKSKAAEHAGKKK